MNGDVEPDLSKSLQEKQNPLSFKDEYSTVGNLMYQLLTKRLFLPLITVIGNCWADGWIGPCELIKPRFASVCFG